MEDMNFEKNVAEEMVTVPKNALDEIIAVCEGAIETAKESGMASVLIVVSLILGVISAYMIGRGHGSNRTAKDIMDAQIAEHQKKHS